MEGLASRPRGALLMYRDQRECFVEHLFAHILLASMEALSHIVYASKEEKINSER